MNRSTSGVVGPALAERLHRPEPRYGWVGVALAAIAVLMAVALVLLHRSYPMHLEVLGLLASVGVIIALAATGIGSSSSGRIALLGAAVAVAALGNIVVPFVLAGRADLSILVPVLHPTGRDFLEGLYQPGLAFSTARSIWPPFTVVVGWLFARMPEHSAYSVELAVLTLCAAGSAALSADLAMAATALQWGQRKESAQKGLLIFALMLAWTVTSYGFIFALERGNIDLIALFFSLLGVWLIVRHPRLMWLSAFSLAVAVNLKLYPLILLGILFWRYRWRAVLPAVVSTVVLFSAAGLTNARFSVQNLIGGGGAGPYLWVGNQSAASYASILHDAFGLDPVWTGWLLLLATMGIWAWTMVVLVRRGFSASRAVLAAAAAVPVMGILPSTSHDYKLVLLVLPLAVLVAVVAKAEFRSSISTTALLGLTTLALVVSARSTLLMAPQVVANKLPILFVIQGLILAVVLLRAKAANDTSGVDEREAGRCPPRNHLDVPAEAVDRSSGGSL